MERPIITVFFADIPDPRVERTRRHDLVDIIVISVLAVVCGANHWSEMVDFAETRKDWLRSFLRLPSGIPGVDTFRRVFAALDVGAFNRAFIEWTQSLTDTVKGKLVAIDGKTLRGSYTTSEKNDARHMVSAWVSENHIVFGQLATEAKSNEITAIPKLVKMLDLAGKRTKGKSGMDKVDALNKLIFDELKFEREVRDESIKFMLLPYVLEHKKGSCLGLAALYLVLAERAGLEVRGIMVPRHLFLRHKQRNIELLRKGAAMPDEWYTMTWQVPEGASAYLRMLTEQELMAVFDFNLANARRMKGEYQKAEEGYRQVIADIPDFAEAHANLGLVLQLQKKFKPAMEAYLEAQALYPGLPGLKQNMNALRTDMGLPVDDAGMLDGQ